MTTDADRTTVVRILTQVRKDVQAMNLYSFLGWDLRPEQVRDEAVEKITKAILDYAGGKND